MKAPFIEISDLTLSMGGKRILDRVSLSISEGEYFAVLGPNGAGKSTLLKCLLKIIRFDEGSIMVGGRPIEGYRPRELAKLVSYVPQGSVRSIGFSVEEFVMMGRYPHLSPFTAFSSKDRDTVKEALRRTGTLHLSGRLFNTLSGGEQQLVFVAASLAQGARALLLDEPTNFLDPRHAADVERILRELNDQLGITIVVVTHDINLAAMESERAVILKSGRVMYKGPAGGIVDNTILESAYDKKFVFARHPVTGGLIVAPDGNVS